MEGEAEKNNDGKRRENGKRRSAGLVVRSKGKYLMCHSTQQKKGYTISQFDGNWSIAKGGVDKGESLIEAAIRELQEETGIDLNSDRLQYLLPKEAREELKPYHIYTTRRKIVHVFLLDDPKGLLEEVKLECTSLIGSSHHLEGEPEMDSYMYVDRYYAKRMVFKNQRHLFVKGFLKWDDHPL
eukprot:TRINITY_DN6206_c0_g1_i1.p1 TRINITY_DN6206_c0_g1~~TRINITY_DN6206_c0_g1_i1.p1  ORF type:complete len:183 (-),score=61.42 TRINITY_DN6206_c0_g1_i1:134-682(-)